MRQSSGPAGSTNGCLAPFLPPLQLSVVSPVKCVKNEIHNILTVLKLTKQFVSPDRFRWEVSREEENPLVQSFQMLFDSLTYVNEFHIDESHLRPFINVIESPHTSGPITTVALAAMNKFVVYGLIQPQSPRVAESINMLASGVLNAQFPASLTPNDEVVMLKILTVLIDTLRSAAGEYLTDETVWQMVKKAYQISRQPRISHLLRNSSEAILQQMVLTIFGCHKTRSTHVFVRPKFCDSGTVAVSPPVERRVVYDGATHETFTVPSSNVDESNVAQSGSSGTVPVSQLEVLRPYGVPCMFKTLKFLAYLTSYGARQRDASPIAHTASRGNSASSVHRSPTPPKIPPSGNGTHRPFNIRKSKIRYSSLDVDTAAHHADGLVIPSSCSNLTYCRIEEELGLPFIQSATDESPLFCEEMRTLGLSLLNVALETGGEEVAKCPLLVDVIQNDICKSLVLNARTKSLFLLSVTLRCVFNMFVYLKQHLKVQFEVFFNSIQLRAASASCEVTQSPLWEQRELALESLLEFCREPDLMVELYQNYDCDVHCTNLFERLVFFLAQASVPENVQNNSTLSSTEHPEGQDRRYQPEISWEKPSYGPTEYTSAQIIPGDGKLSTFSILHRLALSGLLCVIHSIASRCRLEHQPVNTVGSSCDPHTTKAAPGNDNLRREKDDALAGGKSKTFRNTNALNSTLRSTAGTSDRERQEQLREQKEWKRRLELGAKLFNSDPKKMYWIAPKRGAPCGP